MPKNKGKPNKNKGDRLYKQFPNAEVPSGREEIKERAWETARTLFRWAFEPDGEEPRLERFDEPDKLVVPNPKGHTSEVLKRWIHKYNKTKEEFKKEERKYFSSDAATVPDTAFYKELHEAWRPLYTKKTWDKVDEFFATELMEIFVLAFLETLETKQIGTDPDDRAVQPYIESFGRIVDNISRFRFPTRATGHAVDVKSVTLRSKSKGNEAEAEETETGTGQPEPTMGQAMQTKVGQHPGPNKGRFYSVTDDDHDRFDRGRKDVSLDAMDAEMEKDAKTVESVVKAGARAGVRYSLRGFIAHVGSRNVYGKSKLYKDTTTKAKGAPKEEDAKKRAVRADKLRAWLAKQYREYLGGRQKAGTKSWSDSWSLNEEDSEISQEREEHSEDESIHWEDWSAIEGNVSGEEEASEKANKINDNPLKRKQEEKAGGNALKKRKQVPIQQEETDTEMELT
jgi:hypothetical protein